MRQNDRKNDGVPKKEYLRTVTNDVRIEPLLTPIEIRVNPVPTKG